MSPSTSKTFTVPVRILTVNDVYADFPIRGCGGFSVLGTVLRRFRQCDHKNVITTVNGDFLGGASLAETFKGKHIIQILNELEVDYVVIGNHEFDYGPEELKQRMSESKFRWLGSNVYEKSSDSSTIHLFPGVEDTILHSIPVVDPDSNQTLCNLNIGLFGLCTRNTPDLSYPGPTVSFESPFEAADRCVSLLQQKAHVTFALTHVSLSTDIQIAKRVPQLDLILGGHDHDAHSVVVGNTLILKTGQNAYWLGVVDLELSVTVAEEGSQFQIQSVNTFKNWSMIAVRGEEDETIARILKGYISEYEKIRSAETQNDEEILSTLLTDLDTRSHEVRTNETSAGNLVADALKDYYRADGAQIGYINGGFIRGDKVYPAGYTLSAKDLLVELPFPRTSILVEIKGEHLWNAIDKALAKPTPSGAFPHFSAGVRILFKGLLPGLNDSSRHGEPEGNVLLEMTLNGEPIDFEKMYRVVVTEFVARGGDGITPWLQGRVVADRKALTREIVREYLRKHQKLSPTVQGRVNSVTVTESG